MPAEASPLLSGVADVQSTIPANGKKVVSLPAKIKYLDLVKAFKDFKPGSAIPYKADVGLFVDTPAIGKLRLPISKEGQLSVPSIPDIEKSRLEIAAAKGNQPITGVCRFGYAFT